MSALETVSGLCAFRDRGAGTDAERRAAMWLAEQAAQPRHVVRVETFWCRPNTALAQAWHVALALAGSVVTVADPTLGAAMLIGALVCLIADALTGRSPGRRLTPERASQNVVSEPLAQRTSAAPATTEPPTPLELILTAPYAAGRCGVLHAPVLRRAVARARRLAAGGRLTPGWLGWLALAVAWLLVVALARRGGGSGTALAVAQVIPTVALLLTLAGLLQDAGAPFGPAAGDDATGVAVALAVAQRLAATTATITATAGATATSATAVAITPTPTPGIRVVVLLSGAGPCGLRHHLRAQRTRLRGGESVVLGIAAAGSGTPRAWASDGALWPLRTRPRLRALAVQAAGAAARPAPGTAADPRPHRGRGESPAWPARLAGIPALTVGCLDDADLVPGSHRRDDVPAAVDPAAVEGLTAYVLAFIDALDYRERP